MAPINVDGVWRKRGLELICPNTAVRARAARRHQYPGRAGGDQPPPEQGAKGQILYSGPRLLQLSRAFLRQALSRPSPEENSLNCPERRGFIGE